MRQRFLVMPVLLFIVLISAWTPAGEKEPEPVENNGEYHPLYWVEGAYHPRNAVTWSGEDMASLMDELYDKGWRGVMYRGASRKGPKMEYYFRSPFLEQQNWADAKEDGLTPLVEAAHRKGLRVMVNMEGVNPYHWQEHQWTPENIRYVADDLAEAGADAVFEECFEVDAPVFIALARELKSKGVDYISGTDPMLLREANFTTLWPETAIIDIYNYYFKRDKIFNIATLAQHGTLGYGWAKYWGKPTSMISPLNRNWGIATDYSPSVVSYICMIRALQFRLDNFIIFGGSDKFDPIATQSWIKEVVALQEKDRPLMNIVVLLDRETDYSGSEIPGGPDIPEGWKTVLEKCGVDGTLPFRYGSGTENPSEVSLPESQEQDLPYTGYYKNVYLRFTGSDIQRGIDLRAGTVIPYEAIHGTTYCEPNSTYGRGPYIVGRDEKYVVTATSLNWEVAYPISDLLSGAGVLPSSNVWGIAGRKVTAMLAIETTELEMTIPGLEDGSRIRVTVWDRDKNKKMEETIAYRAPLSRCSMNTISYSSMLLTSHFSKIE